MDVYQRNTTNLLAKIPLAAGINLTNTLLTNIGSLENRGVEAAVNYEVVRGEHLKWSVNVNATINRSKITKLSNVVDPAYLGTPTGNIGNIGNFRNVQINTVGYAANTFFLYKQKYENGKPLEGQYEDVNDDKVINERDLVRTRTPAPKTILGFSSNLSYDKASLAFTVRANTGNYLYNTVDADRANYATLNPGLPFVLQTVPDIYTTNFKVPQLLSDYYLRNASFVRLQNVTLGYDFGSLVKESTTLRVTLAAQNVLVLTKYTGLDPERANGTDNNFYPLPRTITLDLNLGF